MRFPKRKAFRSRAYLDYVMTFPCITPECGKPPPSEPHHCVHPDIPKNLTHKGMAQKHSDIWAVPACRDCHDFYGWKRRLPGLTIAETNHLIAIEQLKLMAQWITSGDEEIF